jgi:DNA-binding NarL/FixJ family response regulator
MSRVPFADGQGTEEEGAGVISVLVVGDHDVFSEALFDALAREPGIRVLDGPRAAGDAVDACGHERPDVVLMDLDVADVDHAETTRSIRAASPDTKIIALSALEGLSIVAAVVAAGARGYVPKTRALDNIMDLVRRAAAGELIMPEADLAQVLEQLRIGQAGPQAEVALGRLTPRETEILRALAAGDTIGEIAVALGISAMTVQSHVKNILAKLGVHSKIEAVTLAWRHGFSSASRSA